MAQLAAAETQGGRLPELFSGLDREELPSVVSYPTSCSPQAWASASPLLLLRSLLRFDPWIPHGKVWLAPDLPEAIGDLRVNRIPLAGGRVSIEVRDGATKIEGLPADIEVVGAPRDPLTAG
jgi:glycogen debranching enzyme